MHSSERQAKDTNWHPALHVEAGDCINDYFITSSAAHLEKRLLNIILLAVLWGTGPPICTASRVIMPLTAYA